MPLSFRRRCSSQSTAQQRRRGLCQALREAARGAPAQRHVGAAPPPRHRLRGPPAARRRLDDVPVNFSAYPTALFTITSEFLMSSERAREAVLTLTTWHAMRDLLAPFDPVPRRDRSFECRSILEFVSAHVEATRSPWTDARARLSSRAGPRAVAASSERLGEPKITSNFTRIHARSSSARRTLSGQMPIHLQGKIADSSAARFLASATPALRLSFDHCGKRLRVLQHRFRSSGLDARHTSPLRCGGRSATPSSSAVVVPRHLWAKSQ